MVVKMLKNYELIKILNDNGVSFNQKRTNPKSGYMVSEADSEKVITFKNYQSMRMYLYWYQRKHNIAKNRYVGVWCCDDKIYLDVSMRCSLKRKAVEIGRANNQLAIFSNRNKKSISLVG